MAWTTTDLLADVRRRAMLPTTSTLGLADSDLLAHADNEMASRLVPLVTSVNEEFYVQTVDVPVVSGQSAYRMPNRNSGAKLRDVTWLQGGALQRLARIEPEQLMNFTTSARGSPMGFYLEAGTINLVPAPTSGSLRMKYYVRPGRFTATSTNWARITGTPSYSGSSVSLIISSAGSPYVPTDTDIVDVIALRPPFEYLAVDCTISGASATTLTLTPSVAGASLSRGIAAFDRVSVSDLSTLIQLPVELHSLLAQRVVCAVMETFNYSERLAAAEATYARMEAAALKLITPRVDGAPKKMRGLLSTFGFGPR